MPGFPKMHELLGFALGVFVVSIAINMLTARVPQLAAIQRGL